MPNASIRDDRPKLSLSSETPRVRNTPSVISVQGTDTMVYAGTPIGLSLVFTYAFDWTASTPATYKGDAPRASISTS